MTKPRYMTPAVHSNGTPRGDLSRQYLDVLATAKVLDERLRQAAPHGRDYYVKSGDALGRAQKEHAAMLLRVKEIHDYAEAMAQSVRR